MLFAEAKLLGYDCVVIIVVGEEVGVNDFLKNFAEDVEQADGSAAVGIRVRFVKFWDRVTFCYFPRFGEVR